VLDLRSLILLYGNLPEYVGDYIFLNQILFKENMALFIEKFGKDKLNLH